MELWRTLEAAPLLDGREGHSGVPCGALIRDSFLTNPSSPPHNFLPIALGVVIPAVNKVQLSKIVFAKNQDSQMFPTNFSAN